MWYWDSQKTLSVYTLRSTIMRHVELIELLLSTSSTGTLLALTVGTNNINTEYCWNLSDPTWQQRWEDEYLLLGPLGGHDTRECRTGHARGISVLRIRPRPQTGEQNAHDVLGESLNTRPLMVPPMASAGAEDVNAWKNTTSMRQVANMLRRLSKLGGVVGCWCSMCLPLVMKASNG